MFEKRIFLVRIGGPVPAPVERLVNAPNARAAVQHCVEVQKASASDVARLMAAGVKVEDAAEG